VGVLGISQSSKSNLLNELGRLGNLITVGPASTAFGQPTELPTTSEGMVSRVGPVTNVTQIGAISNVYVYRSSVIPTIDTDGISLTATDAALPATLGATLAHGTFLNAATGRYPAVVLGAEAASLLGINNLANPTQIWIGGHWFTVVGILKPVQLVSGLDSMAFIGFPIAERYFGFDGHPTELYLRSVPTQVNAVAAVLPATVSPADPSVVAVGFPSDFLKAELVTKGAYNGLLLGLGAVALLVGGVGIANVMVISMLERRSEIGLRRALGANRRHVAEQFLAEALLLSLLGGVAGTVIGALATIIDALSQHESVQIPPLAFYGGVGAALIIGAIAGLYPSMRAARLSPTEALRTV
jgi:putative ABC transport system permease protein